MDKSQESSVPGLSGRNTHSELAWLTLTATICAHFALVYDWSNPPFLNLGRYAAGLEGSPFQERVLMAYIFRACSVPSVAKLASHLPAQLHNPYILIQLLVSFAALFGAVGFTRGSIRYFTHDPMFSRWAALLVVFMCYFNLVLIYGPSFTLPYDVPSLFFFSGCLYCLFLRRYTAYYLLFILGAFNRETICFASIVFLIWQRTPTEENEKASRSSTLVLHVAAQLLLWVAIKIYLGRLFAANPQEHGGSSLFVPHFQYNLRELLKPQQWPLLLSNFGFTLPFLISQRDWIRQPAISRICGVVLPLWLLLMLYVGVIIEIRIFTELIAIVSIAVALILFHRWKDERQAEADESRA